jgi:hypothetical protein
MPKLKRTAKITRDPEIPWFVVLSCPYVEKFAIALTGSKFPGAQYIPRTKKWLWPIESVETLVQLAKECGLEVQVDLSSEPKSPKAIPPSSRSRQI